MPTDPVQSCDGLGGGILGVIECTHSRNNSTLKAIMDIPTNQNSQNVCGSVY